LRMILLVMRKDNDDKVPMYSQRLCAVIVRKVNMTNAAVMNVHVPEMIILDRTLSFLLQLNPDIIDLIMV
jgi:hypothetical protein